MKNFIYIVFIIILFSASCGNKNEYPDIPAIEFKRVELRDSIGKIEETPYTVKLCRVVFSVTDGDGNIGLEPNENQPPFDIGSIYYNNLFVELYQKINGIYQKVDLAVPHSYRTPYILPDGQNKAVKADFYVKIEYTYSTQAPLAYDTIQYRFYIYDRALNCSNTETTPEISLKQNCILPLNP